MTHIHTEMDAYDELARGLDGLVSISALMGGDALQVDAIVFEKRAASGLIALSDHVAEKPPITGDISLVKEAFDQIKRCDGGWVRTGPTKRLIELSTKFKDKLQTYIDGMGMLVAAREDGDLQQIDALTGELETLLTEATDVIMDIESEAISFLSISKDADTQIVDIIERYRQSIAQDAAAEKTRALLAEIREREAERAIYVAKIAVGATLVAIGGVLVFVSGPVAIIGAAASGGAMLTATATLCTGVATATTGLLYGTSAATDLLNNEFAITDRVNDLARLQIDLAVVVGNRGILNRLSVYIECQKKEAVRIQESWSILRKSFLADIRNTSARALQDGDDAQEGVKIVKSIVERVNTNISALRGVRYSTQPLPRATSHPQET